MFYFLYIALILFGIGFVISGSQKLTQEVKTNMAPEDIEMITNELTNRKYVGQIILVTLAIIFIFYLT